MSHVPLSSDLEKLLATPGGTVPTLNALIGRTHERGIYLVLILLCLPFISPIPVPGLSNVVGVVIMIVGYRMIFRLPQRLPRFLGDRQFSMQTMEKVISMSTRFLKVLEKLVKPRKADWMNTRLVIALNASFLIFMAFLLALPIPPIVPFSNSLPAYAIIFLSASMMETDSRVVWLAYGVGFGTVIYLATAAGVIWKFFATSWEHMLVMCHKFFG